MQETPSTGSSKAFLHPPLKSAEITARLSIRYVGYFIMGMWEKKGKPQHFLMVRQGKHRCSHAA